jgi:hypothetical protein
MSPIESLKADLRTRLADLAQYFAMRPDGRPHADFWREHWDGKQQEHAEITAQLAAIESLEASNAELRKALDELYDAMLRYQSDAETEAPAAHRQMMHRVRIALGLEQSAAARALEGREKS